MFRTSARQLARCSRLPARQLPTRPALCLARLPQTTTPAALAARRFNSTNSPKPNGDQGDRKDAAKQQQQDAADTNPPAPPARKPLPPGWVYLTDEELNALKAHGISPFRKMDGPDADEMFEEIRKTGVPEELRDVVRSIIDGTFSMKSALKIPGMVNKLWSRRAQMEQERAERAWQKDQDHQQEDRQQPQRQEQEQKEGQEQEQDQQQHQKQQSQQQQNERPDDQTSKQSKQGSKPPPPPPPSPFGRSDVITWVTAGLVMYALSYGGGLGGGTSREITWQELRKNFLDRGLVEKLVVMGNKVNVELNRDAVRTMYPDSQAANPNFSYYFSIGSIDAFERRLDEAQNELGVPPSERIPVSYASEGMGTALLLTFGPTALVIGLLFMLSRRAGGMGGGSNSMFGFGKSRAKMFNHDSSVKVKFADVAGMDEAKVEIMEFVSFLRTPERFQRLGAKIPRGAILSGPPGTGKTLLAKATAGESQVPFFSVSGSEFVEMFVGVGASRVRDLFATARKNAPCIIFIDEIDAIGRSRSEGGPRSGGNDEREATLNQILTEMDGFNTSEQVVVLAGTNRPDVLDKALMRPGRFDRHINIDLPTMKGRQAIFKVHLKKILTKEEPEYLTGRLAALTPGFAGADIANVVNEAALIGKF